MNTTNATQSNLVATKLEVVIIPVSDVDRAKRFYLSMGWRLDADFVFDNGASAVQLTPPGSQASIIFGKGVTTATPGSTRGVLLAVDDIAAARAQLVAQGVEVSEVFHGGLFFGTLPARQVLIPTIARTTRTPRSPIRTATAGSSRRSRRAHRVE